MQDTFQVFEFISTLIIPGKGKQGNSFSGSVPSTSRRKAVRGNFFVLTGNFAGTDDNTGQSGKTKIQQKTVKRGGFIIPAVSYTTNCVVTGNHPGSQSFATCDDGVLLLCPSSESVNRMTTG